MLDMAKKKPTSAGKAGRPPNRSPSWVVYARLDPALQGPVEEYMASFDYPPALARVIERALTKLLQESGHLPKPKPGDEGGD